MVAKSQMDVCTIRVDTVNLPKSFMHCILMCKWFNYSYFSLYILCLVFQLMKQLGVTTASGSTTATSSAGTMATAPSNATDNILDLDTSSVANSNSYEQVLLLPV